MPCYLPKMPYGPVRGDEENGSRVSHSIITGIPSPTRARAMLRPVVVERGSTVNHRVTGHCGAGRGNMPSPWIDNDLMSLIL
jgi:hypothetical protein